ncbi:MAG TPA: hypothetical protein VKE72_04700 [Methylocella sp.]|jgi:hypothetical protein|nr:hypothetical protein [Methylocella sp.]
MNNFYGIDNETIEIFRRLGIGTFYGLFLVGASILAARLVMRWHMRRVEKILARMKPEDAAGMSTPPDKHESPSA